MKTETAATKGSALARVKPSPQASGAHACAALRSSCLALRFSLRFVPSASRQGWVIPLGLTLATPDLAGQATVAGCNPTLHSQKGKNL